MTIRSVLRRALFGLAVVSLALQAGDAAAAKKGAKGKSKAAAPAPAKKKSIALGAFSGNKTKEIRGWVQEALESDFTVTDAEDFKPKNNPAGYEKMASDLGVDAVIVGKVEKEKLTLTIRGSDGAIIKDLVVKAPRGPRLKRAIEGGVPAAVGKSLGAAAEEEEAEEEEAEEEEADEEPPPKKKPEPEEEKPEEPAGEEGEAGDGEASEEEEEEEEKSADEEKSEADSGPKGDVGVPFVAGVGVRFMNRKLSFNDTLTELNPDRALAYEAYIMRDYELRLDPVIYLHLQLYPGVFLGGDGFITNVGIVGGFEQGIPVTSNYAGQLPNVPRELKNNTQEWFVGMRLRFPSRSSEFGATGTYGKHSFILEGDENFPIVPDTAYSYLRVGGDAWFSLGKFFVGVDIGLRAVLGTGELEDFWFENAAGNGLDVGLRMGFELTPMFSLVVGGDMIRYGFDFNPIDRDTATRVAGGAIDQYLSAFLGAKVVLGGKSSKGFGLNSAEISVSPKETSKDEEEPPEEDED